MSVFIDIAVITTFLPILVDAGKALSYLELNPLFNLSMYIVLRSAVHPERYPIISVPLSYFTTWTND